MVRIFTRSKQDPEGTTAAKQAPTIAFNEYAGLAYTTNSKQKVTSTAERGGKKITTFKDGHNFVAIEGKVNAHGDLRVRCAQGWVTIRLSDGTKLCRIALSATAHGEAPALASKSETDKENSVAAPTTRRPRSMTVALTERKSNLAHVFNVQGTPTKKLQRCAERGKVDPTIAEVAALIVAIQQKDPEAGIKKLAKTLKEEKPLWNVGCKEVRQAVRSGSATLML